MKSIYFDDLPGDCTEFVVNSHANPFTVQMTIRMKHKKAMFVPRREGISCRIERENPISAESPLVSLPDFTYMDGRPTPLGVSQESGSPPVSQGNFIPSLQINQMQRVMKQREYANTIVTQLGELDFAKQRYAKIVQDKANQRQAVLDSKLKEKGGKLLRKSS